MRGAGSEDVQPHIGSVDGQSPVDVHSLWQVHTPTPGPPHPHRVPLGHCPPSSAQAIAPASGAPAAPPAPPEVPPRPLPPDPPSAPPLADPHPSPAATISAAIRGANVLPGLAGMPTSMPAIPVLELATARSEKSPSLRGDP